jgi:Phytanoyl-CoA dioxygenase (PhyH)
MERTNLSRIETFTGVSIHTISGSLDDERRGELVYAGGLLVFRDVAPLSEVARLTEEMIGEAASIDELQARFKRDQRVNDLFRAALEDVGVAVERTYWDPAHLRVVPPIEDHAGPQIGRIGVHRDTWGSNVPQQTNWWATLRPLSALRTIAFYPRYWEQPIANNSADWDLDAVRERRRSGVRVEELPIVPEPTEPVDTESELRMVIEPGDFLCFSGAHLHASVPNTSDSTRYSVELRTVYIDDLTAGRGAPNLDGRAPAHPLEWFRSMDDGTPLRR